MGKELAAEFREKGESLCFKREKVYPPSLDKENNIQTSKIHYGKQKKLQLKLLNPNISLQAN
jgi:hypothetical protein